MTSIPIVVQHELLPRITPRSDLFDLKSVQKAKHFIARIFPRSKTLYRRNVVAEKYRERAQI